MKNKVISDTLPEVPDEIFATSELSAYLAANLINQADVIDFADYPETKIDGMLNDALKEANAQNPTIPMISYYNLSTDGTKLEVVYLNKERRDRLAKMDQAREVLDQVVADHDEKASDLEKVTWINQYIIDHGEYDHEAFDRTQEVRAVFDELDIASEDEQAYSLYGIAVDELGVCASYADTFVYLARKAGLEAIVVNGTANGDPKAGHAWNAVKIDDKWRYFDTTWNDTGGQAQAYFDLDKEDPILTRGHAAGTDYILPMNLADYE